MEKVREGGSVGPQPLAAGMQPGRLARGGRRLRTWAVSHLPACPPMARLPTVRPIYSSQPGAGMPSVCKRDQPPGGL